MKETKRVLSPGESHNAGAKPAGAEARAETLARLGFLLSAAREPLDAAQHVVDATSQFFQWDASSLMLYNAETDRVNDVINIDTLDGRRQRVVSVLQDKPPSRMMRKVMDQGAQLILRKEAPAPAQGTVPFGDRGRFSLSLMYVPMRLEGRPIGVLSVQSYKPKAYNQKDLKMLQGIADHAAGAFGRLQAEAELRASEERLRLAAESSGLGTWEYDQAAKQFSCSRTCASILGLNTTGQISFESFLGSFKCGDSGDATMLLQRTLADRSDRGVRLECRILRPDASERWVILVAKRFLISKNPLTPAVGLLGTILDITQRKQIEDNLRAAQEELRAHARELEATVQRRTARLQETVGELEHVSYALKHDMRAPLRAMQVYAQLAEEELTGINLPAAMEYFRLIRVASQRLDRLIQDSLSYNRAVVDELPLAPVDLGGLLAGLVETYPQLRSGKAEIKMEKNLPVVLGNEAALTQAFANLLDNAVKFVRPGQNPSIHIRAEPMGDCVRIWVEDRGIGIPKNLQNRIFQMFQRGTNDYEGTGIGLAIVWKVVQRMGGRTGVESEEGQGSRFWVELKSSKKLHHSDG